MATVIKSTDLVVMVHGSAHDISQVPDESVHVIPTSPPYYGMRSYGGEQDEEWPTVTYRLNEWVPSVTVPGCDPKCKHEWSATTSGGLLHENRNFQTGSQDEVSGPLVAVREQKNGTGRYCVHCGGWRGPLGLEPSPVEYIGHLILCLREWRRVLRPDGLVFVNLGDSYNGGGTHHGDDLSAGISKSQLRADHTYTNLAPGLKPKDLMLIPAMFALAARADGWWLRSDIVWAKGLSFLDCHKGAVMPENVNDRPTRSQEMVYMLAKSKTNYWDDYELRDGGNVRNVWSIGVQGFRGAHYAVWPEQMADTIIALTTSARGCCPQCGAQWRRVMEASPLLRGQGDFAAKEFLGWLPGCNHYGVKIPKTIFRDAPLLRAKQPKPPCANCGGSGVISGDLPMFPEEEMTCPVCGGAPTEQPSADWLDYLERVRVKHEQRVELLAEIENVHADVVPPVVMDPFAGSGTTGRSAARRGVRCILVDKNAEYLTKHASVRTTVQVALTGLSSKK